MLQRGWQSLSHLARISTPANRNLLLLPCDRQQAPTLDGKIEVCFGDIIFSPAGSEEYHRAPSDIRWASLSPTAAGLASAAQTLAGHALPDVGSSRVVRPRPALVSRLFNLHKVVSDLATTAPEILAHSEVAKVAEESLLRAMLGCITDPGAGADGRHPSHRGMAVVNRFECVLKRTRTIVNLAEKLAQVQEHWSPKSLQASTKTTSWL